MIDSVVPQPSREERTEAIRKAFRACAEAGLTQIHDMGVDLEGIAIYKDLLAQNAFPLRVYAAIDGVGEAWARYLKTGPEGTGTTGKLVVRALKLYADGALGSRGAALIEPYADDPGNRGLTLTSAEDIRNAARQALDRGFQVCVHAIGDRANHMVLNVYEELQKTDKEKAGRARLRIEHAQVLDAPDIPRFSHLGVLPMMQPTHCTSDMPWVADRLGPRRTGGAYAWRSLITAGSIIPAGSDFPVESPNPLWGFYAAITRQDHDGWPAGGWMPEQRMTRAEALKAFTIWAAYAGFQETDLGTIETGKLADLVVLSKDIMTVDPKEILGTAVAMTVVGGEIVYSALPGASEGPSTR
jgi:hypothetical protein